jgi:hypothetical protein
MYKIIGANQLEYGPVSADQLRQWITEGRADANTQAQLEGTTEWKLMRDFPDFAAYFPPSPPTAPFPSPSASAAPVPVFEETGRILALQQVSGPAVGLMVTAAPGFVGSLLFLVISFVGNTINSMQGGGAAAMPWNQLFTGSVGVATRIISILVCVFIFYGALKMRKLENHGLCMAASIVAMIPCLSPCCLLGLPIGIWAVVILSKPEIKQYFT